MNSFARRSTLRGARAGDSVIACQPEFYPDKILPP